MQAKPAMVSVMLCAKAKHLVDNAAETQMMATI